MARELNPPPSKDLTFTPVWIKWFFTLYERVRIIADLIVQMTVAGYGGASQEADIGFNIPAGTYITLPYDTLTFPSNERGFIVDIAADTFKFTAKGAWRFSVDFNIENISEQNQSRTFELRLFNVTDVTVINTFVVPVSRNQGDILQSLSFLVSIPDSLVDKVFRIELGGIVIVISFI